MISFILSGQALANIDMTFQGQTPGQLTELGISQAQDLAKKYLTKEIKFDKIICSDLFRAKQTFEQIKPTQDTSNIEFSSLVREIHNKYYEGKKIPLFLEEVKNSGEDYRNYKRENSESWNDVFCRAKQLIDNLIKENVRSNFTFNVNWDYKKIILGEEFLKNVLQGKYTIKENISENNFKKILLISHGQFIRELLSTFLAFIDGNIIESFIIANASVNSVKIYCPECKGKCKDESHKNIVISFSYFNDQKLD